MEFRHEEKFEINFSDMLTVRQRMRCVAYPDPHAVNGVYRIRCYNGDSSVIHLEKKSKLGGLGNKQTAPLTAEQTQRIIDGNIAWMTDSELPLIQELHAKMFSEGLLPRTIVDYTREPFVYPAGNVRVTLDYDIRTGMRCTDFLNDSCVTVPASDCIILEVKWDAFLPDMIKDAVSIEDRRVGAFSKYAACRKYG